MNAREAEVRQMIEDATRDFFDKYDALYKGQFDRAEAAEREAGELRERVAELERSLEAKIGADWREALPYETEFELKAVIGFQAERVQRLTEALREIGDLDMQPDNVTSAHMRQLARAALSTGEDTGGGEGEPV